MRAGRGDQRLLRRVIALLAALAVLAERVAGRSAPARFLVLWILRRAESVAADFVFEQAGMPPLAIESTGAVGNDPANALGLAARFHALVAMLCALLPLHCPCHRRPVPRGLTVCRATPRARHLGGLEREPFDTS